MASDPRHLNRQAIVQELFAQSLNPNQSLNQTSQKIWGNRSILDPEIEKVAVEWPLDKLNKIDLAILRLAVWELLVDKKEPIRVIIDEAVELGKKLGSESSASFVNGVLGAIVKENSLES